jgi:hypothetical protein
MNGISSCIAAIELINSDEQTPDDDAAHLELRCAACGYGAAVRVAPEACPMCHGTVWEHVPAPDRRSLRSVTAFSQRPARRHLDEGKG